MAKWDLKIVSNLIKKSNDYSVESKYNFTKSTHFMLKWVKHYWWMDNNFINNMITKRLSQTTYYFQW